MLPKLILLFKEAQGLVQQIKFDTDQELLLRPIDSHRESIIAYTSSTCEGIESIIKWLDGSEFDLIQWNWPTGIQNIEDQLKQLMILISNRPPSEDEENLVELPMEALGGEILEVAKSIPPIIKLSRLFFNKLSKPEFHRKQLPISTGMRSDQLEKLDTLTTTIREDLDRFLDGLKTSHLTRAVTRQDREITVKAIVQITGSLDEHFNAALFLIFMYFVPVIPDDTKRLSIQNNFRTWFVVWYDHLRLALHYLEEATVSFRWNGP
ncbi:hypothetical protein MJO29_015638 [Puccinia striiformis f. sp. tritici]|nr:hypothetical protein MJO29_015638 [Puccinia striiformis f. sp. tritici]